jgi:hypothetical protein
VEWILIFGVAFVFYGVIPGFGAFWVRSRWRSFRRDVIISSQFPIFTYQDTFTIGNDRDPGEQLYRFFGTLEGIQEDNSIWLRRGNLVITADMTGQEIVLLPSTRNSDKEEIIEIHEPLLREEMPNILPWNRVSSFSEGTKVYIAGPVEKENGRIVFKAKGTKKLLLVFYDGEDSQFMKRVIWNSRHRNEYWNQFTPAALGLGSLGEMIVTYYFLTTVQLRIPSILAIGAALMPVLPFIPPGFFLFILYRWLWGRARFLRAERDLVRLPLRFFPDGHLDQAVLLPTGEEYFCMQVTYFPKEELKGRGKLRSTLLDKNLSGKPLYNWFGIRKEKDPFPGVSRDPMVENIILYGNPEELAVRCEQYAYRLELLSSLCFGSGLLLNLLLALRLLSLIIR